MWFLFRLDSWLSTGSRRKREFWRAGMISHSWIRGHFRNLANSWAILLLSKLEWHFVAMIKNQSWILIFMIVKVMWFFSGLSHMNIFSNSNWNSAQVRSNFQVIFRIKPSFISMLSSSTPYITMSNLCFQVALMSLSLFKVYLTNIKDEEIHDWSSL